MSGNPQKKEDERVFTYDEWEAITEMMKERDRKKRKAENMRTAHYFQRQKIYGSMIALFGIVCIILGHLANIVNMEVFGILVGLAGLYVVMTKEMMLVDEYFLEYRNGRR